MKIGQLAEASGVTTQTIRYYEEIGLMPEPPRESNGYRSYDASSAERLTFIKDAQASGLSLVEIQIILELRDQGESTCGHVIALLQQRADDISQQMKELERSRNRLEKMIDRARSLDPAECRDPVRCQTISA